MLTGLVAIGSLHERLKRLLEPVVEEMGYELICVEYRQGDPQRVRLYIDGPDGIGLEDCERVSRQVVGILDVHDPVPGEYVLEVSSPGDDRPLVKPQHFMRFKGERIRVRTLAPIARRRNFTGQLVEVAPESIALNVDGEQVNLRFDELEMARLAPQLDTAGPRRGSKR